MVVHHGEEEEGVAMLVRLVGSVHADDELAICHKSVCAV